MQKKEEQKNAKAHRRLLLPRVTASARLARQIWKGRARRHASRGRWIGGVVALGSRRTRRLGIALDEHSWADTCTVQDGTGAGKKCDRKQEACYSRGWGWEWGVGYGSIVE